MGRDAGNSDTGLRVQSHCAPVKPALQYVATATVSRTTESSLSQFTDYVSDHWLLYMFLQESFSVAILGLLMEVCTLDKSIGPRIRFRVSGEVLLWSIWYNCIWCSIFLILIH